MDGSNWDGDLPLHVTRQGPSYTWDSEKKYINYKLIDCQCSNKQQVDQLLIIEDQPTSFMVAYGDSVNHSKKMNKSSLSKKLNKQHDNWNNTSKQPLHSANATFGPSTHS